MYNDNSEALQSNNQETILSPELKETLVLQISENIVSEHSVHFEKEYHGVGHVVGVDEASANIFDIISDIQPDAITEEMEIARRLAALGHDLILKASEVEDENAFNYGQLQRVRGIEDGGNEHESAMRVIELAEESDFEGSIVTEEVKGMILANVEATYPDFRLEDVSREDQLLEDPTSGEIIDLQKYLIPAMENGNPVLDEESGEASFKALLIHQPTLGEESSLGELAVALGDLSASGRLEYDEFESEGNGEFRESHPLIGRELEGGVENLTPERKAKIAGEMLGWASVQVGFVLMQKKRLDHIVASSKTLDGLSSGVKIKEELLLAHGNFDDNIIRSTQRVDALRDEFDTLKSLDAYPDNNEALLQLAHKMGY